jgi:hypothetical protein
MTDYERGYHQGKADALATQNPASCINRSDTNPRRPWVGLTDEDKAEILSRKWWNFEDEFDLAGFSGLIEAKLKEKNGG